MLVEKSESSALENPRNRERSVATKEEASVADHTVGSPEVQMTTTQIAPVNNNNNNNNNNINNNNNNIESIAVSAAVQNANDSFNKEQRRRERRQLRRAARRQQRILAQHYSGQIRPHRYSEMVQPPPPYTTLSRNRQNLNQNNNRSWRHGVLPLTTADITR